MKYEGKKTLIAKTEILIALCAFNDDIQTLTL